VKRTGIGAQKVPNDSSIDLFKEILPAGRGMKDCQLLVLNNHMKMAGVGELAELFVRSPHLRYAEAGCTGLLHTITHQHVPSRNLRWRAALAIWGSPRPLRRSFW
jgi:hypothetical protein